LEKVIEKLEKVIKKCFDV
jgi:hypothetical protein